MAEINEAVAPYSRAKVVGGEYIRVSGYTVAFIDENRRIFDRMIYIKAVRRVGGYLGLNVGDREVSTLSMVIGWNWQNKRTDGGPLDSIVGWSGYTTGWKRWINWGFRSCFELGLLENKPVQGGQRVCITDKGMSVLRALDLMSEIVVQEIEGKREKPKRVKL